MEMHAAQTSTVVGEVLQLEGALNFASMPRLLEETGSYASQPQLPDCLAIDFAHVTEVDSAAVALMLHWCREAHRLGKALRYIHLPPNLQSLAELYGVDQFICPAPRTAAATA